MYVTSDLSFQICSIQSHKPFCYVAQLPFPIIFLNDSTSSYWSCFSYCEVDYNHLDSKKYDDYDYDLGLVHKNIHAHAHARNKISVITDISVLGFYGYIGNIGGYFDKNIGKTKINKNTLKFIEILC